MSTGVEREILLQALEDELEPGRFQDYCPNGLQVEGRRRIRRMVTGVTASLALIEAAIDFGADLILVHHGYFWKGEPQAITGMKHQRIAALLQNQINLVAYHLPLDAHPRLGNNVQLGRRLGLRIEGVMGDNGIGLLGSFAEPRGADELVTVIAETLDREPLWISGGAHRVRRVGLCTGAAQSMLVAAAAHGVDAFISGEVSEQTTHEARELGVHFYAAGHHATERYGPQAVGVWCAERFGIEHLFIDIANPA